jgi:hypothetical protein
MQIKDAKLGDRILVYVYTMPGQSIPRISYLGDSSSRRQIEATIIRKDPDSSTGFDVAIGWQKGQESSFGAWAIPSPPHGPGWLPNVETLYMLGWYLPDTHEIEMLSSGAVSAPTASEWRAWAKRSNPDECACGIHRSACDYHR